MLEAIPFSLTTAVSSLLDQRDSGFPESRGNVQARAVTWVLWVEEKKTGAPRPWCFLQQRTFPAARPPLAHGPDGASCLFGDCGIVPLGMFVSQDQNLSSDHLGMWCFSESGDILKLLVFLCSESNRMLGFGAAGHMPNTSNPLPYSEEKAVLGAVDFKLTKFGFMIQKLVANL